MNGVGSSIVVLLTSMVIAIDGPSGAGKGTVARRGMSGWQLVVSGRQAHSSGIFSPGTSYGAIFTGGGLAWAPGGREVWFTAAKSGSNRAVYAVNFSARQRLLARVPGSLTLHDVSSGGRVVITRDTNRQELFGRPAGELKETVRVGRMKGRPGMLTITSSSISVCRKVSIDRSIRSERSARTGSASAWTISPSPTQPASDA